MSGLSSDALERQFGPTRLEVLKQDEGGRIICTKVIETDKILELSQVVFRQEGISAFPDIHRQVLAGTSIGKAFAEAGMPFRRDIHASYPHNQRGLPAVFSEWFGSDRPSMVTDLSVVVGPDSAPYADILEVYSADVNPWELAGGEMDQATAERFEAFGATLAVLKDTA